MIILVVIGRYGRLPGKETGLGLRLSDYGLQRRSIYNGTIEELRHASPNYSFTYSEVSCLLLADNYVRLNCTFFLKIVRSSLNNYR
jgi:hypothetical protein